MQVRDLIEILEQFDEEAEVFIAEQPGWPFEYAIDDVVEVTPEFDEDESPPDDYDENAPNPVYIVEGNQLRYLPGYASEQIGWR